MIRQQNGNILHLHYKVEWPQVEGRALNQKSPHAVRAPWRGRSGSQAMLVSSDIELLSQECVETLCLM